MSIYLSIYLSIHIYIYQISKDHFKVDESFRTVLTHPSSLVFFGCKFRCKSQRAEIECDEAFKKI